MRNEFSQEDKDSLYTFNCEDVVDISKLPTEPIMEKDASPLICDLGLSEKLKEIREKKEKNQ